MKQWCEITDKEYDEAQRIKREQERIQEEKRRREGRQRKGCPGNEEAGRGREEGRC